MATLTICSNGQEETYEITTDLVSIGRSRTVEVKIDEDAASRVHCQIRKFGDRHILIDLKSSNGTCVNDQKITERELADGDCITIGQTRMVFHAPVDLSLPPEPARVPSPSDTGMTHTLMDPRIRVLLKTILASASYENFDSFVTLVLDNVVTITRADRGFLLLRQDDGDLRLHTGRDKQKAALTEIQEFSKSIPKKVFETGQAIVQLDTGHDDEGIPTHSMVQLRLRTVMCAPLRIGERVLGAIYVDSRATAQQFSQLDLALFEAVTNHLALAMENVKSAEEKKVREDALRRQLEEENERLRISLGQKSQIVGASAAMLPVYETIRKVAPTEANVLLLGESGTGKEAIAHSIHDLSPRSSHPFVIVDCASIPETLLESELFGYEKGAFTGAAGQKMGRFELADRGTLFLDEIGDLPLTLQSKLLRAIQEQEFMRVGGTAPIKINVRIIAATNRDLKASVDQNKFRSDLYFRLNVVSLQLPPLRDRGEDILTLAEHFLKNANEMYNRTTSGFTAEAKQKMMRHRWPGNVRELKHRIEQAVILGQNEWLMPEDLNMQSDWSQAHPLEEARDQFEKGYILNALRFHQFNVSRTAGVLGISRQHLQNLMKKYGITRDNGN